MTCSLHENFDNFSERVNSCKDFVNYILECDEEDPLAIVYTEECDGLVDYFQEFSEVNRFLVPRENNGSLKPLSPLDGSIQKLERFLKKSEYGSILNIVNTLKPDEEVSWRIQVLNLEREMGKNIGHAPGLNPRMLDLKQNYQVIKPKSKRYMKEITAEDVIGYHVLSKSGTDILVERDEECIWENEYYLEKKDHRGSIANLLPGEVYMEKEDMKKIRANGRIVADLTAIGLNQNFRESNLELILDLTNGEMRNLEVCGDVESPEDYRQKFLKFVGAEESKSPVYLQELGVGLLLDKSSGTRLEDIDPSFFTNGEVLILEKLSVHFGLGITKRNRSKILWQTHGDVVLDPRGVQIYTVNDKGKENLVYEDGKLIV